MSNYMQAMGEDWKVVSSTCRPLTHEALSKFKELQSQLNRVAHAKKMTKIDVDGRIGPKTVTLYNQGVGGFHPDCSSLASSTLKSNAIGLTKAVADMFSAPASVKPPGTSRPSIARADGTVGDPPGLAITDTLFGLFESPIGLILLAGGGYLAYKKFGKKKAA